MIGGPVPTESVYASTWLSGSLGHSPVYADWIRASELAAFGSISPDSIIRLSNLTVQNIPSNAYIYLGPENVQQQSIAQLAHNGVNEELSISSVPEQAVASRVYDNGLVEVYRT